MSAVFAQTDLARLPILGASSRQPTLIDTAIEKLFDQFETDYRAAEELITDAIRKRGIEPIVEHNIFEGRAISGEIAGQQFYRHYAPREIIFALPTGAKIALGFVELRVHGDKIESLELHPEESWAAFRIGEGRDYLSFANKRSFSTWAASVEDAKRLAEHLIMSKPAASGGSVWMTKAENTG